MEHAINNGIVVAAKMAHTQRAVRPQRRAEVSKTNIK